ncbi:MAG: ribosome assembly cofactor RimP [Bacteroidales bacterium]
MIDEKQIVTVLDKILDKEKYFLVEVSNKKDNIKVIVDGYNNFRLDDCIWISRRLKDEFRGELDDYNLEVTSPGLNAPFKVKEQYEKNIGREVEVLLMDGAKVTGTLQNYSPEKIQIEEQKKIEEKGKKSKTITKETGIDLKDIKKTKLIITF